MSKSSGKQTLLDSEKNSLSSELKKFTFICISLFVFSFLLYINTLGHNFVLDDPLAIELNKNVTSGLSGIVDIFKGGYRENDFGGQLYRPVSLVQFAVEWEISPNNPAIHHFFNVLWYAACVVLVFMVLNQWFYKYNVLLPVVIALLFAAHPIHTEVVANIKSRDEIMSLFFVLSSFLSFGKYLHAGKSRWLIGALLLYFLALISKESAVTMFPIFAMISWWMFNSDLKKSFLVGMWFVLPVIGIFIIRHIIFGSTPAPVVDIMDNPIVSAAGFTERIATSMVVLWKYFTLLILPHPLSSDYSYSVIPVVGFDNILALLSVLLHAGILILAVNGIKSKSILSFFIFTYLMAISLFSQIPMVIGTMFGERLAFLPSFWFISGVVFLFVIFSKEIFTRGIKEWGDVFKPFSGILSAVLVIVIAYSVMTINRNTDWKNNSTLFIKDAATYPGSVRLNSGAAEQMLREANTEGLSEDEVNRLLSEAEGYCQKIMAIKPVATAYLTLGNIRLKQKKYEEANSFYDKVNDLKTIVDKNKALAYRELGRQAGEKEQNLQKSQEMLNRSLTLNDQDAETWFLIGVSFGVSGNHQKAAENFEKAYTLRPSPEYAKNVITAYQYLGNSEKVAQYQKILTQ